MYIDIDRPEEKVYSPIVGVEIYGPTVGLEYDGVYDPQTWKTLKHAVVLTDHKLLGFFNSIEHTLNIYKTATSIR